MSTRRRIGRERYTVPQRRSRGELLKAVGGVAAVVVGTLVMVWLLRPGTGSASGGLVSRQPRAAWLIVLTASAALAAVAWLRRTRSRLAARPVAALVAAMALVAVAAVAAGAMWPGGLLRHTPGGPPAPLIETETTLPTATSAPVGSTTTPQSGSTVPAETTTPGVEATAPAEATAPTETTGGP